LLNGAWHGSGVVAGGRRISKYLIVCSTASLFWVSIRVLGLDPADAAAFLQRPVLHSELAIIARTRQSLRHKSSVCEYMTEGGLHAGKLPHHVARQIQHQEPAIRPSHDTPGRFLLRTEGYFDHLFCCRVIQRDPRPNAIPPMQAIPLQNRFGLQQCQRNAKRLTAGPCWLR